jgi:hypothetical protein
MKRFVIEFVSGAWDGNLLDSESDDREERGLAHALYFKTSDGQIGQDIDVECDQTRKFVEGRGWPLADDFGRPLRPHYQIIDRRDEAERIVIVAKQH